MVTASISTQVKPYLSALKALVVPGVYAAPLENSILIDLPLVIGQSGPEANTAARARAFIEVLEKVVDERLVKNDQDAARMLFAMGDWAGIPARDRRMAVAKLRDKHWTWENNYRKEPLDRDLLLIFLALKREGESVGQPHEHSASTVLADEDQQETSLSTQPDRYLTSSVICYNTKFAMPDVYLFWTNLYTAAQRRFYLVGGTNKSWINKGVEQSRSLGESIIRILLNGGQVKFISKDDPGIIDQTRRFFRQFVVEVSRADEDRERAVNLAIEEARLIYVAIPQTNYDAVVSDNRLVLLPIPNTPDFRSEAMVLEFTFHSAYHPFMNYVSDIDRIISETATIPLMD